MLLVFSAVVSAVSVTQMSRATDNPQWALVDTKTRAELVRYALLHGLLEEPA